MATVWSLWRANIKNYIGKSMVCSSSREACNSRDAIKIRIANKSRDARESM